MMKHLIEQHIAVTRLDGLLSVTSIITQAPLSAFSPREAIANGFIIDFVEGEEVWSGGITDEGVERELSRTIIENGVDGGPFVSLLDVTKSWRRMDQAEEDMRRVHPEFRHAFKDDGVRLRPHMETARDKAREIIRNKRNSKFVQLDNAAARYSTKGALGKLTAAEKVELAAIEEKRQALRDAPANPAIDKSENIDQLRSIVDGV